MNKKFLLLTALLISSLAIAPLQANWQNWLPSKTTIVVGSLTTLAALWTTSKIIEHKYRDELNAGKTIFFLGVKIQKTNEKGYFETLLSKGWSTLKKVIGH